MTGHARVKAMAEEHGISAVKMGAVDIDGLWRGKRIQIDYFLDSVWRDGSHICNIIFGWDVGDQLIPGLRYTGWQTGYPDFHMVPDLSTFAVVPWEPGTASVICDFVEADGSPVAVSPREVLRRVVAQARALGYEPRVGYEVEFYLFKESAESVRQKEFAHLTPVTPGVHTYNLYRLSLVEPLIGDIVRNMSEYGIRLEAANTEYGPGQFEINLHYDDAMAAADQVVMYKHGVREIAAAHGAMATFMAKYDADWSGSSGHLHQSLWGPDGRNLFWDEGDGGALSALARRYAAGLVATMPDFTAFLCPTVNSYKRKVDGSWAPTTATWGIDNRTTGLRMVPAGSAGTRIEHRLPGADANPYLAIAACIAGGIHGIQAELEPPEPVGGNAYELGPEQVVCLPRTLDEAVGVLEDSKLARELLDERFVEHFLATRRWELECSRAVVTDWERSRYFEMI